MIFDITLSISENSYIVTVSNFPRGISRERILEILFTDKRFIDAMDEIDSEWWYKTDRIIIDLSF